MNELAQVLLRSSSVGALAPIRPRASGHGIAVTLLPPSGCRG